MFAIFKKDLIGFFSSLTAYLVMVVFLALTGLFMWIIPGNSNLLDTGYANLDSFFTLAPWVFMFLIPAVSMRQFSDEKRLGTIELLFTRPLSDNAIVWGKFLSTFSIIFLAILPTFIYFISVYRLGNPVGNMDLGGTWGSYIGLFLLAAGYASIGLFASSLTDNQVVSFTLALILTFLLYYGLEELSALIGSGKVALFVQELGIQRHYVSISRGVVDTRDLVYFASVILIFNTLTRLKLQARKW